MAAAEESEILSELIAIKKLIAFALLRQPGITQNDIAGALGISQAQVSRMFTKSSDKKAG